MRRILDVLACCVLPAAACVPFVLERGSVSEVADAAISPAADSEILMAGDASAAIDSGAIVPPDGADDANTSVVNEHPQGSFDGPDCLPWEGYMGTLALVQTEGVSVRGSCWADSTAPDENRFFAMNDLGAFGPVSLGTRYQISAWVKNCPNKTAATSININPRIVTFGRPYMILASNESVPMAPTNDWKVVSKSITVASDGKLEIVVGGLAPTSQGACFLVDDVVVQKVN
jgi:hypothetical protein